MQSSDFFASKTSFQRLEQKSAKRERLLMDQHTHAEQMSILTRLETILESLRLLKKARKSPALVDAITEKI